MSYRKTFSRIILIAWSTIAVMFVMWSIVLHTAEADSLFNPAVNYDTGDEPSSVAIGYLNGDGALDLAVANENSDNVSVLLGNGDGTFKSAVNYGISVPPLSEPRSLSIGDLDKDGASDLAVANGNGDGVSVLLGKGDGTFQDAVDYKAREFSRDVAIGDLDRDGAPDLAVAGGEEHVSVLLGNGDGTFKSAVHYQLGDETRSLAIEDLDGDGTPDLAVATLYLGNVSVLLGNGDGTFQDAVDYKAGRQAGNVAIGDLDRDDNPDIAVTALANGNGDGVSVLLGNGDGTFKRAMHYEAGPTSSSVAIGDLDKDGAPDLAVTNANGDSVSVLLGNGDGTFQSAVNYEVGNGPESVAIGDLDGDGYLDLAVVNFMNDNVSILINTGGKCVLDSKFKETSITVGEHYYADRSYTITGGVPSWMVGRTLIKTPNDERFNNVASGYLRFKTPVSWWVYVLFDSRASTKPDWLNGWEHRSKYKISTSLKSQPYLEVWRKYFNAGQCVNLGGNFGPGSSNENRSNFAVVYGKGCVLDPKFEETSITVGEHYYADRSYTITGGVPSWMVGRTLIKTPNDERFNNVASGYLRFKTPVSWWVYVLFDSRTSSKPDWLNGWEQRSQYKIYTSLKPQPYLEVWRKYFNAGQCVNLGGNFGPGSSDENRSNFAVVYGK